MAKAPEPIQPTEPTAAEVKAAEEEEIRVLVDGYDDGPVTFTRPGVESMDFTVKDGVISTTKEGRDWLLTHALGTPTAD